MTILSKIRFLLNKKQEKEIIILFLLLLIGVLFEILGLGALIPVIGLLSDPQSFSKYFSINQLNYIKNTFGEINFIYIGLIAIVLLYIVKSIFLVYLSWKQNKFASNLTSSLSNKLFDGYLKMPYQFHINRNSSIPLSILQNEIGSFSSVVQAFIQFLGEGTILVGIILTLFLLFPIGTIFVILFFGISVSIFFKFSKSRLNSWGNERHMLLLKMNKDLMQGFGGIKDLKIYGRENYFSDKYKLLNNKSAQIFIGVNTLSFVPRFFLELIAVLGLISLIILMLFLNQPLNTILQSLGVFVAAAFRMIPSVNRMMVSTQQIKFANVTIEKLYVEYKTINENKNFIISNNKPTLLKFENLIEFKNVSFGYNNSRLIINNLNLKINSGEFLGIIGSSGSGKSTIVDLLLGLLVPTSGEVYTDGELIINNLKSWQNLIGYVPQTIYLTDDSLKNNIGFGIPESEIDIERVNFALKAAQLNEYINSLSDGINTNVGERGVKMSGGQRQRIGIARALYNQPKILVLDEATSALDNQTEHEVMESIYQMKNITIIIIAHRLSTLNKCNRIIEVKSGKIETIKNL